MTEIEFAIVGFDDGTVQPMYAIRWEGSVWLVTAWLIERASGIATPERMIRVSSAQVIPQPDRFQYANVTMPKSVVFGLTQDTPGHEVRSLPDAPRVSRQKLVPIPRLT